MKKSGDTAADKKGGGRGKCYVCGSKEHFAHKHCGWCESVERRTRDCEERGADKGVMLAKLNVPTNYEVGPMAAKIKTARGGGKEEWASDSDATFPMSHTCAGLTAYKEASPGTKVEVTNENILYLCMYDHHMYGHHMYGHHI